MLNIPEITPPRHSQEDDPLYDPFTESLSAAEISDFIDKFPCSNRNLLRTPPPKRPRVSISDSPFLGTHFFSDISNCWEQTPKARTRSQSSRKQVLKTRGEREGSPRFGGFGKENSRERFTKSTAKLSCPAIEENDEEDPPNSVRKKIKLE